jgi:hypothetical protein
MTVGVRWPEFRVPDCYAGQDEETFFVPTRSAATEDEAFEHLLTDRTDWSWREEAREEIRVDYRYDGIHVAELCEHPLDERHRGRRGCRVSVECHRFVLDRAP